MSSVPMFLVALLGIGTGLFLILLIARHAPAPAEDALQPRISPDDLESSIRCLARSLGLEVLMLSWGTGGLLEATLRDRRPWIGGRLLLHAATSLDAGQIGPADVLAFADLVRGEQDLSRGILISLAGFTDEARAAAASCAAPVELVEGSRLLELVREQQAETT